MGIMINHYKDPYKTTSIMESNKGIFAWLTWVERQADFKKKNQTVGDVKFDICL